MPLTKFHRHDVYTARYSGDMARRILVTGSRHWRDRETIERALLAVWLEFDRPTDMILMHGDCPTGADQIASDCWKRNGLPEDPHPADWDRHGRAAGPIRNQHMVDIGADVVLAFPLGKSPGTRGCIKAARAAGLPVRIYEGTN